MTEDVGKKIKELRTSRNMTLKELSKETNLSIGFLSQLERGLTSAAIDTLSNIATALKVNNSYFLTSPKSNKKIVLRNYEKEVFQVDNNQFIQYHLTNDVEGKIILPRLVEILPLKTHEDISPYQHEGEEFVYVLEGVLTLHINNEQHDLFPGDSAHYNSTIIHNWANYTNKTVKVITVHTPNDFKK